MFASDNETKNSPFIISKMDYERLVSSVAGGVICNLFGLICQYC